MAGKALPQLIGLRQVVQPAWLGALVRHRERDRPLGLVCDVADLEYGWIRVKWDVSLPEGLVSAPLTSTPSLAHSLDHSRKHSLAYARTHSLTHSLIHSPTHTHTHTHTRTHTCLSRRNLNANPQTRLLNHGMSL